MRVLVLGGTGSIGTSVVGALLSRQHEVVALARSESAEDRLTSQGAEPLRGDLRQPEVWADAAESVDAIIQVAGDFTADAGMVGRNLISTVLRRLSARTRTALPTYIYTGGCWLYGGTGDHVATEESPFNAPAEWAWSIDHMKMVLGASHVRGILIHPAMVYERDGGVLAQFHRDLLILGRVRIFGDESVRWPMVHRSDIGALYSLALERAPRGASYNGAAVDSVTVGALTRAIAQRAGAPSEPLIRPIEEAVAEFGEWARGYAIDQRMSGAKARRDLGWLPAHTDPIADIS
jgi:nucleoside-diphosphate-sugar epimerase